MLIVLGVDVLLYTVAVFLSTDILNISELPKGQAVVESVMSYDWHINTKYYSIDVFLSEDIFSVSRATQGTGGGGVCHVMQISLYQLPILSASGFLAPDSPLLVSAPFLFWVHLHGMTFPFLSDRNPLWTHSNLI